MLDWYLPAVREMDDKWTEWLCLVRGSQLLDGHGFPPISAIGWSSVPSVAGSDTVNQSNT
jgi:hypothetical protein